MNKETSDRKIEANRANAEKSTGPTSPWGKAKSAQNALKHGFFSKAVVLADEDPEAYELLRNQLWDQLRPRNVLEEIYVREITDTTWRLQRMMLVEKTVFTRRSVSFTGTECNSGFAFVNDAQGLDVFAKLSRYEALLTRKLHRAVEQFRKAKPEGIDKTSSSVEPTPPIDNPLPIDEKPNFSQVGPNSAESAQPENANNSTINQDPKTIPLDSYNQSQTQ